MGIVCMNDTRDYWAQATAQPFITSTFTRDRFLSLLSNLRVSGDIADAEDKLAKLPMIDMLKAAIQKHHYPGEDETVDEAMILFKGRSDMRQHIAKKASPTGFKIWMLVDVATNYVYSFDIYTGKNKMKREENATANVVLKLIEPLAEHCWHRIGMDGFFTSVQLFQTLLSKGFYAVGTTRHTRKHFPKELLEEVKNLERGKWVWRQHGEMVCFSWMDKKPVNLLSTFNDAEEETVSRPEAYWQRADRSQMSHRPSDVHSHDACCRCLLSATFLFEDRSPVEEVLPLLDVVHDGYRHTQRFHPISEETQPTA